MLTRVDIRFSKDPTPYKTYFSAAWSRTGRKGPYAHYFIQIQPNGGTFLGKSALSLVVLRISSTAHGQIAPSLVSRHDSFDVGSRTSLVRRHGGALLYFDKSSRWQMTTW
jgi:hypothetical protein